MNGNSLGVLSSRGLAAAERSEGERSEPQRSGAAAKAGAGSPSVSPPDSEVVAKPKRLEVKLLIAPSFFRSFCGGR
jgi:hypothetical protein